MLFCNSKILNILDVRVAATNIIFLAAELVSLDQTEINVTKHRLLL